LGSYIKKIDQTSFITLLNSSQSEKGSEEAEKMRLFNSMSTSNSFVADLKAEQEIADCMI